MKLLFEFPRRSTDVDLDSINGFLRDANFHDTPVRKFGIYLKNQTDTQSKKKSRTTSEMKNRSQHYLLKFKFFDNRGKEIKDLTLEIDQGYFDPVDEKVKKALSKIKRDVCILSYVASLDLEAVKFYFDSDLLAISVELDNSYQNLIDTHKKLIFPEICNN